MSAWIVTKLHIAAMVKWYATAKYGRECERDASHYCDLGPSWNERKAALLYAENVRSVNHRYPNHEPSEPVAFTEREIRTAPDLTPVQMLKACACLEYQSCETEDYRETEAYKLMKRMENAAIGALPGYEDAPWGIDSAADLRKSVTPHA